MFFAKIFIILNTHVHTQSPSHMQCFSSCQLYITVVPLFLDFCVSVLCQADDSMSCFGTYIFIWLILLMPLKKSYLLPRSPHISNTTVMSSVISYNSLFSPDWTASELWQHQQNGHAEQSFCSAGQISKNLISVTIRNCVKIYVIPATRQG